MREFVFHSVRRAGKNQFRDLNRYGLNQNIFSLLLSGSVFGLFVDFGDPVGLIIRSIMAFGRGRGLRE